MSKPSFGDEIYGGAATFGRIEAWIGAVVATLLGLAMLVGGIMLATSHNVYTGKVQGTITQAICSQSQIPNQGITYNCSLVVQYVVNGTPYLLNTSVSSGTNYLQGQFISVNYNPTNPADAQVNYGSAHLTGWILIGVGLFIIVVSWLWVWVTYKSKFAAAAGGVAAGAGMIGSAIRG